MVVLEATVDETQVERELEQIEDPEVEVNGEMTPGPGLADGGDGETASQLGNISRRLLAILGVLGVLLQLDTVVEILDGLFRAVEVALLPLIGLINAFLRPLLENLLRFMADFDFDNITGEISGLIDESISRVSSEIQDALPDFVPEGTGETITRIGGRQAVETVSRTAAPGVGVTLLDLIGNEFSNAGLTSIISNDSEEDRAEDSPGSR